MRPYSGGVRHDYKETVNTASGARTRRWLLFGLGLSLPVVAVLLLLISEPNQSKNSLEPAQVLVGPVQNVPLPIPPQAEHSGAAAYIANQAATAASGGTGNSTATAPDDSPPATAADSASDSSSALLDLVVRRGDTLDSLFRRNHLSIADLAAIVRLPDAGPSLRLLKPGDHLEIAHRDSEVLRLNRPLDETQTLTVERQGSAFEAVRLSRALDVRTTGAHGVIENSLFEAGTAAGISDKIIMDMAGIFQWDIDFIQDVRSGDEFTVIYQEMWRDGVKLRDGDIVAAEFVNQGKAYRAARYRDDYYTPDGRSVRKAFIRAPVDFTRISSNFNPHRLNPVLNKIRAHQGVDYAAPIGTPVRAAGDGKVIFRGVRGGYGNAIVLQHGGNITTLYGHLSRFAKARVGSRVKQGEIIGYVGQTGLATGPHLHYEYRVNGVHRNPRTVQLPPADPVPAEYQADFRATTATLWRQLDLYQQSTTTASN